MNSPNLGVGALTISNALIVEELAKKHDASVRFTVFQWRDLERDYANIRNVEVVRLKGYHLLFHPTFLSKLRACDFVLDISAGDGFSDIYGAKRFVFNALSKVCVLLCRRPLVLSPQTIGPFNRWWARTIARLLLRSSFAIVTRDSLSMDYTRKLSARATVTDSTDVAFVLPYTPSPDRSHTAIRVGINISGLLFNGGYTGKNMFALRADYPKLIRSLLKGFVDCPNCEVHLIPHVTPTDLPIENDRLVSEALLKDHPTVTIAPPFSDPTAAKNYISRMDFFCGSRMHACIAAVSSGVPTLPIAYSRKFIGLFGSLGYNYVADCGSMTTDEVVEQTFRAFAARAELRDAAKRTITVAADKLRSYEAVLELLFTKSER